MNVSNNPVGKWYWSGQTLLAILILSGALAHGAAAQASGILSKDELKALVTKAETAADHMKLSHHFAAKAGQLEAEAKEHEVLAKEYRRNPTMHENKHPMSGQTAQHCELFARQFAAAAKEARTMAADHDKMAKEARK